ncbi:MAG: hypothetical protein JOY71_31725, partial [Acetobacteraceae bacterium]|nr:hypothetical protein [Acetobacteraceae bacterium]
MHTTSIPRSILLALAFLATGAAADPDAPSPAQRTVLPSESSGDSSAYLSGRFAASQLEFGRAGDYFLQALAAAPLDQELVTQAFLACLDGGRPEAIELAKRLPGNQTAQLLLAGVEAKAGNWAAAERRFQAIPPEGLNQVLQPLLLAWSQQGAGQTDLALATLAPYVQGQHLQSVYALHAALIADLAGRNTEAAQFYQLAQAEPGTLNLRSAEMLASWEMRQGRADEALEIFRKLAATADEMAIALPDLSAAASLPVISQATDGIAETYLALAAALRQQDASDSALLLIRLALNLKPNFTAARLLLAEIMEASKRPDAALATLAAVDPSDPLISIVRLRRAALTEALGKTDDAIRMLEQMANDYPSSPIPYAQEGDLLRAKN